MKRIVFVLFFAVNSAFCGLSWDSCKVDVSAKAEDIVVHAEFVFKNRGTGGQQL